MTLFYDEHTVCKTNLPWDPQIHSKLRGSYNKERDLFSIAWILYCVLETLPSFITLTILSDYETRFMKLTW